MTDSFGRHQSGFGYHLVKFLGEEAGHLDSVEDRIVGMLFQQKTRRTVRPMGGPAPQEIRGPEYTWKTT